jgi:transposase
MPTKRPPFSPMPNGNASEVYCRGRSQAKDALDAIDRQVLCGILWIMDSGSSWRDLPEEKFGPNSTLHGRYRKWCKEGLWPRILEVLGR